MVTNLEQPTRSLDHHPITELGHRKILCDEEDGGFTTNRIWNALLEDAKDSHVKVDAQYRDVCRAIDKGGKWRSHLIWHYAEQRVRQPGGLFWFIRHIITWRKLLRYVHDWHCCSYLESSLNTPAKYFFAWHRSSFKSVMLRAACIWAIAVSPTETVIYAQGRDEDITESMGEIIGTLEENVALLTMFPHLEPAVSSVTGRRRQWGIDGLRTAGHVKFGQEGFGRDYSLRGASAEGATTGKHPTLTAIDDLHTLKNTRSINTMIPVKEFFEDLIGPSAQSDTPIWMIGTYYRIDDVYGDVKAGRHGEWHHTEMPLKRIVAEGSPMSYEDPLTPGQYVRYMIPKSLVMAQLTPAQRRGTCGFDPVNDLEYYKRMRHVRYTAQMMLDPIPPGQQRFPAGGWLTYPEEGANAPWFFLLTH